MISVGKAHLYLLVVWLPVLQICCTPPPPPAGPTAPEPLSGVEDDALVVFAVAQQAAGRDGDPLEQPVLVPLVCRKPHGQLGRDQACLGVVPEGGELALEGGQRATPGARARPYCPGGGHRSQGLALDDTESEAGFAVWPPAALTRIRSLGRGASCRGWCSFVRSGHPRVPLTATLRRQLLAAARDQGLDAGHTDLELVQQVSLDLNRDGAPEQLYSVVVPDHQTEEYDFVFSALFLVAGGKQPAAAPRLLLRRDSHAVVLRGTMDLDRDRHQELWVLLNPAAGAGPSWAVLAVDQRASEVVGGHDCRQKHGR